MSSVTFTTSLDTSFDVSLIPDHCLPGALLLERLRRGGVLDRFAWNLKLNRQGGYQGLEAFVIFLLFFSATQPGTLTDFYNSIRPFRMKLAALAELQSLPSRSALSRLLGGISKEEAEHCSHWLLNQASDVIPLLSSLSALHRDGAGQTWHVFDIDGTDTVLRHRALPLSPELPEPRRRSYQAQPGYTGRKRGEVKLCRTTLQHAGTSLWLGNFLAPGNAPWRAHSAEALAIIVDTCKKLNHPCDRALARADGVAGNTPFVTACQESGLNWLARSSAYPLLDLPRSQHLMANGPWLEVEDSCSGPRRFALDLGDLTLPCDPKTLRADGTPYAPVTSRVVVSRYKSDEKHGAGQLRGGWFRELFVTGMSRSALLASEVVTEYFRRSGLENRLAQEDKVLALDQLSSYHLPGQQFATSIGLFTWNQKLLEAFRMCQPLAEPNAQLLRCYELFTVTDVDVSKEQYSVDLDPRRKEATKPPTTTVVTPPNEGPFNEVDIDVNHEGSHAPEKDTHHDDQDANRDADNTSIQLEDNEANRDVDNPPAQLEASQAREAASSAQSCPPSQPRGNEHESPPVQPRTRSSATVEPIAADAPLPKAGGPSLMLAELLRGLDWTRLPQKGPMWRPDPDNLAMRCPNKQLLRLQDVRPCVPGQTMILRFRTVSKGTCQLCTRRVDCTRSTSQYFHKEVILSVSQAQGEQVSELLRQARVERPKPHYPFVALESDVIPCPSRGDSRGEALSGDEQKQTEKAFQAIRLRRVLSLEERLRQEAVGQRAVWPESLPDYGLRDGRRVPVDAVLLPASLRHDLNDLSLHVRLRIEVAVPEKEMVSAKHEAQEPAERERRRQDWWTRIMRYRLPPGSRVQTRLSCIGNAKLQKLQRFLDMPPPGQVS